MAPEILSTDRNTNLFSSAKDNTSHGINRDFLSLGINEEIDRSVLDPEVAKVLIEAGHSQIIFIS